MSKLLDACVYSGFEVLSSDLIANCAQAVKFMDGICVHNGLFRIDRKTVDKINLQFLSLLPFNIVSHLAEISFSSDLYGSVSGKI